MAKIKLLNELMRGFAGFVAFAAYIGAPIQGRAADDGIKKVSEDEKPPSVIKLQTAASRGNPEAMYELAMLHVEGGIPNADYDQGIRLLKKAAAKGNQDAQRMYAFMDNAFSGEGC